VFEFVQVPVQVLVSLGLFYSLYLLVCRILPLGHLCDRLLCLWAVALAILLASPVTLLRVPPTCWVRGSLSSTPAAVVLTTLSNIELLSIFYLGGCPGSYLFCLLLCYLGGWL